MANRRIQTEGVFSNNHEENNAEIIRFLQQFKQELLFEVRQVAKESKGQYSKPYLKSHEVMRLLCISKNTLQTLRNKGLIPCMRIGGVMYYPREEIEKMISEHSSKSLFHNSS